MTEESKNRIDLLRRYIDGTLQPTERIAVESNLSNQRIWQEELNFVKTEKSLIKEAVKNQLKQQAQKALKSEKKKIFQMQIFQVAAAVIILVSAGFWYTSTLQSPETLFTQYYKSPVPSIPRSENSNEQVFASAMDDFGNKEFAAMQAKLEELRSPSSSIDQSKVEFFSAVGFLEADNFENAIQHFAMVSQSSVLFPDAQWFLALTLLRSKRIEECKNLLSQISNSNHYKKQDAADLLGKLRN